MPAKPGEKKHQILQALACMLESPRPIKITTAALAAKLGVSESALYRHFSSKAQMFEGLIAFIEETLFSLINKLTLEEKNGRRQVEGILLLLLGFAQKNPGMTRVLIGDVLVHENEHLQNRINKLHNRLEVTLKQVIRFAISEQKIKQKLDIAVLANLLMCYVIGRWHQFVRSGFIHGPTENWEVQRTFLLSDELYGDESE